MRVQLKVLDESGMVKQTIMNSDLVDGKGWRLWLDLIGWEENYACEIWVKDLAIGDVDNKWFQFGNGVVVDEWSGEIDVTVREWLNFRVR